jgi:hypothetical protein
MRSALVVIRPLALWGELKTSVVEKTDQRLLGTFRMRLYQSMGRRTRCANGLIKTKLGQLVRI